MVPIGRGPEYPLRLVAAALALAAALGCGAEDPAAKTYPVRGKVLLPGGKPFPGGVIEFRSAANPAVTVKGTIAEGDGTFSLTTLLVVGNRSRTLPGAPAGEYRVTVIPPMQQGQTALRPILLPKACTVKAQDGNEFTLQTDLPRGRR